MAENTTKIPCRLESVAIDGQLGGTNQIYDDTLQLFQNVINGIFYDHKDDSSIHVSQEDRYRWDNGGENGKIAAILSFANFAGTPEQTTNPEWEYILIDASSHILLGINHDHEVKTFVDLDEILEYVTSPDYGLIDLHEDIIDTHNASKLAYISTFCTLNGEFEENPEWNSVILDASNNILLGIKNDNELHLYATIDEIFDILEVPKYSVIEMYDTLDVHVNDSSIHITQSERDAWNTAQANVQSDWNEDSSISDAYIKNKPLSLPASDVYDWAKASTKPSYTNTEVGLGNVTNDAQVKRSEMGAASGVATLGEDGKVPASQLPGFVDDVLEYDSSTLFPASGEGGKIYIDKSDNNEYRWSGSIYVQISKSLVIGTTTGTAFDGSVGHSHVNNSDIHVTANDKSTWNGKADKSSTVSNVSYDSTGKKITKTINGNTTDVVSASTIVTDGGGIKQHQSVTDNNPTLAWGTKSKVATIGTTDINVTMPSNPNTDTKNTAGSTNSTNKLFLIGAQTQAANPQTYSNVNTYIDASGNLFNNGYGVLTTDTGLTEEEIGKLASILSLAQNCGSVESITNPEWVYILLDADNKILLGINRDHQVKIYTDLDELLEYITPSPYSVADLYDALDSSYYTTDETFTQEEILKLGLILSLGNASNAIDKISNPEYKFAMLDSSTHVLLGVKNDDSWYLSDTMDEMLAIVIDSYRGSGAFADRPTNPFLGQQYFCTNKQTTEGATNGIPIWYNGSNWVDALGRTVS